MSFWRENSDSRRHSITDFSKKVVVTETSYKCQRFIMWSEEFFTTFNNDYRVNVSAGEKYNEPFRGDYFARLLEKKKKLSQYLVLVTVLVIESKFCVLYFKW